jgi:hypothetical protein
MTRPAQRFSRQIDRLARRWPRLGGALAWLTAPHRWLFRLPVAVFFILGGLVGFLPVVGFWMLPIGVLLIAVDLPVLRPAAGRLVVRLRAVFRRWNIRL